ncbi:hypothetical protein HPC49_26630 [Pyxidicoccus fallax]|uniref:STAS/SEC14 domain-containing protein n=1 Tax=Pyxidicoccus fallax TaxID=394095 RepID=A0A848LFW8_9BACT|nr:hypothetical protein [Pyxidicoccus fallax]NMO16073.1 hypothetical protein [Pyxidicoccus fallax]NPC81781.1 hypothetical protein [Pyxidicoccus fallax]
MSRQGEWEYGEQRAWVEPPDILWARFRGAVTLETSQWSCGVYRERSEGGRFYLAADITGSHLSPESRRYLVEHAKADWFLGLIYIGAGLDQKVTTKSLIVGSMLSGGKPLDMVYVDTVEQARAWIEQHRAARVGRTG